MVRTINQKGCQDEPPNWSLASTLVWNYTDSRHICISSYLHICKSANLHARMWVNRLLHIYCHLHCAMHIAQCASLTVNSDAFTSWIHLLTPLWPAGSSRLGWSSRCPRRSPASCRTTSAPAGWSRTSQLGKNRLFLLFCYFEDILLFCYFILQDDPGRPNWGGTDWFKIGQEMFSGGKISFVFSLSLFVFTWNQFSNTGFERKCLRSCYEDSWNFEDILLSHLFGYLDICYFVQGISERNLVQRTKHGNVDKIWR